jgi:predicted flavoprotein YhiN
MFPCWSERGEVLFRSFGLSGIVIFNLSREARENDLVELDLTPELAPSELQQLVDPFARGSFARGCLDGVLDPKIAESLERLARERWQLPGLDRDEPASESAALISLAKSLPLRVTRAMAEEGAQVTRGGLENSQFSTDTLECAAHPRLFACGEALDVDGACGGFNLSWAWKSAMVAGRAAADPAAAAATDPRG